jgi:hypothetical protein
MRALNEPTRALVTAKVQASYQALRAMGTAPPTLLAYRDTLPVEELLECLRDGEIFEAPGQGLGIAK